MKAEEIRELFFELLPQGLVDGEDYEIVSFPDATIEPAGARLDLYIGSHFSRTIVEEGGNTFSRILNVETSEAVIDDFWVNLSVIEIVKLIKDTMRTYHGLVPGER